jgi:hypothetical protein
MRFIKHCLFLLFFLVFSAEFIQTYVPFINAKPLQGFFIVAPKPVFTSASWLAGTYQDSLTKNFEDHLALHPALIRTNNQLAYSLFNETNSEEALPGKDEILYDHRYIESYLGERFVGDAKVVETVRKLAVIQNELKKRNIDFLFVLSEGKASFYPDNFPDRYKGRVKTRTNYDAYSEQLIKQNINHIDFARYFLKMKPVAKHALFPKCGVHWSGYGATVAADTLFHYMENMRDINLTDYYYAGGEVTTTPRNTDEDIVSAMNLWHDVPSFTMYYPNIIFKPDTSKAKPNVLIVGDSYVRGWFNFYPFFQNMLDKKSAFWYYNREVEWSGEEAANRNVAQLNLQQQTMHRDYIIIAFNEFKLEEVGGGFLEQMYDLLKGAGLQTP